jgi:uncharacterized Tic20 family protein
MTQPSTPPWDETQSGGQQPGPGAAPPGYGPPGYGYPPPGQDQRSGQGQQPGYGQQPGHYGQQPGYQPPGSPPGGYPPGAGYQPPGPPPPGYPSREDKNWSLAAHFGGTVGTVISVGVLGFVAPLIVLLGRGHQAPAVRAHAVAALNFFIPVSGAALILLVARVCLNASGGGLLFGAVSGLLYLIQAGVWIAAAVFGIVAGIRANDGQLYRYPIGFTFVH